MITTTTFADRDGCFVAVAEGATVGVYVRAFDRAISRERVRDMAEAGVEDIEAGHVVVELHQSKVAAGHAVMSGVVSRAAWRRA